MAVAKNRLLAVVLIGLINNGAAFMPAATTRSAVVVIRQNQLQFLSAVSGDDDVDINAPVENSRSNNQGSPKSSKLTRAQVDDKQELLNALINEKMCGLLYENNRDFFKKTIEKALSSRGIESLVQLGQYFVDAEEKIKMFAGETGTKMLQLESLLKDIKLSAEEVLDGKILPENGKEVVLQKDLYVEEAASATSNHPFFYENKTMETPESRVDDIILVLGESGSGKTFFSLGKATTSKVGWPFGAGSKHVIVREDMTNYNYVNTSLERDLIIESIIDDVKNQLKSGSGMRYEGSNETLAMRLSVVLDEAGAVPAFFGEMRNYDKLYLALSRLSSECRLIVSGTGLDSITSGISSTGPIFKYRMQSWNREMIVPAWKQILKSTGRQEKKAPSLANAALVVPTLASLCTNGRAAKYVLYAILGTTIPTEEVPRVRGQLSGIVENVCRNYVAENGLASLTPGNRAMVAASILHELHRSEWETEPTLPNFIDAFPAGLSSNIQMARCAEGLLRVHVEKSPSSEGGDSNYVYTDVCGGKMSQRSSSVSPAVSVLVYYMLGAVTAVSSSFKSFETVCSLYAIKRKVLQSPVDDWHKVYKLFRLQERIPEPNASMNFKFPLVSASTVWINGDKAPFGDACSRYELHQAKLREGKGKCVLDLHEELQKKGALKWKDQGLFLETSKKGNQPKVPSTMRGHVAISCMYKVWDVEPAKESPLKETAAMGKDPESYRRSHHFPEVLLHVEDVMDEVTMVSFNCKSVQDKDKIQASELVVEDANGEAVAMLDQFPSENPLSIFFHTNVDTIAVKFIDQSSNKSKGSGLTLDIKCENVDERGAISEDTLDDKQQLIYEKYKAFLLAAVKENTHLRYCFSSSTSDLARRV